MKLSLPIKRAKNCCHSSEFTRLEITTHRMNIMYSHISLLSCKQNNFADNCLGLKSPKTFFKHFIRRRKDRTQFRLSLNLQYLSHFVIQNRKSYFYYVLSKNILDLVSPSQILQSRMRSELELGHIESSIKFAQLS